MSAAQEPFIFSWFCNVHWLFFFWSYLWSLLLLTSSEGSAGVGTGWSKMVLVIWCFAAMTEITQGLYPHGLSRNSVGTLLHHFPGFPGGESGSGKAWRSHNIPSASLCQSTSDIGPDQIPGEAKNSPLDGREARPHCKRACRKWGFIITFENIFCTSLVPWSSHGWSLSENFLSVVRPHRDMGTVHF